MLNKLAISLADAGIKFAADESGVFEGYASVFNGVDSYGDTILPGAYKATLKAARKSPILMLYSHNPRDVIGKWHEMVEDERGLYVKGEFTPGHTLAADVYRNMKFGAISGLSIGYMIPEGGAKREQDGRRIIKKIDLFEISVVSMPADSAARVDDVKSAIEAIQSLSDAEGMLRDAAGFSRKEATAFVSRLKAILQSDSGEGDQELAKALSQTVADLKQIIIPTSLTKGI